MGDVKMKAKYSFDDGYDPEYATGVLGGVLPSGELVVNFYLERMPIPYETEQEISDEGKISTDLVVTEGDPARLNVRRSIKSGVILSKNTTLSVYRWMRERLIEMGVGENEL